MKIKEKRVLLIISILLIVAICILVFILANNNIKKNNIIKTNANSIVNIERDTNINSAAIIKKTNSTFYRIKSWDSFLEGINCINSYNYAIENLYNEKNGTIPEDTLLYDPAAKIISYLDKDYISQKGLSKDGLDSIELGKFQFVPETAYYSIQSNYNIVVYGYLINKETKTTEEYGYLVEMNNKNKAVAIVPYDGLASRGLLNIEEGKVIDLDSDEIEKNEGNEFSSMIMSDLIIANFLLNQFKYNAIYKPEIAFEQLESDYASKFGNAELFCKYIEDKNDKINMISISKVDPIKQADGTVLLKCYDKTGEPFYIGYTSLDNFKVEYKFSNITI